MLMLCLLIPNPGFRAKSDAEPATWDRFKTSLQWRQLLKLLLRTMHVMHVHGGSAQIAQKMVGRSGCVHGQCVSAFQYCSYSQDGPTYEQQIRDGFLPVWQGSIPMRLVRLGCLEKTQC